VNDDIDVNQANSAHGERTESTRVDKLAYVLTESMAPDRVENSYDKSTKRKGLLEPRHKMQSPSMHLIVKHALFFFLFLIDKLHTPGVS
jgi:hypothetical protein